MALYGNQGRRRERRELGPASSQERDESASLRAPAAAYRAGRSLAVGLAKEYKVGYRAYWPHYESGSSKPEILAVSWDIFHASTVEIAMAMAVKRVPAMIGHPGCSVGIRYVKERVRGD